MPVSPVHTSHPVFLYRPVKISMFQLESVGLTSSRPLLDITGTTVFSLELEVSGWKENKCLKAINIRGAAM